MGPQASTYIDLLDKCNNITVDTTGGVLDFGTKAEPVTDYSALAKKDARCANDSDPKMTIVRVAAFDTVTMKAMVCIDFDDEKSCADIGQASAPANDTTTSIPGAAGWTWPVKKESLDNPSGAGLNQCWLHYRDASSGYHAALDIDVSYKPVYAANSGKVIRKANDGYATLVIQHEGGLASVYMHMSSITVSEGDTVTAGQQIGISGEVGAENAPHLHFGITTDPARFGTYADPWATVNPLDFLPNDYSPALLKNANGGSCVTSEIKGQKGYGFDIYKVKGSYALYK
jgi:murein DD-endopeptidase MepM/ murein hydrolase activator NlpD